MDKGQYIISYIMRAGLLQLKGYSTNAHRKMDICVII